MPFSANRQIARAAGTVMAAFVLSNTTGLIRQILVSRAFGTEWVIDAYNAASTYPDVIFSLIAGGALASAFVPTLTGFLAKNEPKNAWHLTSAISNLVFLALTIVSLLSAAAADQIVSTILAPKFAPPEQQVTAELLRILLIAPAIFGLSGILMGVLNAHQVFLWPALAPTMYWLGMIFGVLFLVPSMGIYGLAWGAVGGAALHLAVQLPALFRLPERQFTFTLGLNFSAVRQVGRLMAPRLFGQAVIQLNMVVNTILATGQPEGSLTAIRYAWAIMTMPQVVIAQAIAIAALPTFSAQVARGELGEMRNSLAATLRSVILLALPATLGLILLREPLISLLFERGQFDMQSTQLVAWALLWYTSGLVAHSVVEIVSRAFYALHDTLTPVLVGAGAMSLNVVFSILFSNWFARLGWMPHGGLALGNTLATSLEMVGLLVVMRRRLNGLDGRQIWQGVWQTMLASAAMSACLWLWLNQSTHLPDWLVGAVGIGIGVISFLLVIVLVRNREVLAVLAEVRQRLPG